MEDRVCFECGRTHEGKGLICKDCIRAKEQAKKELKKQKPKANFDLIFTFFHAILSIFIV